MILQWVIFGVIEAAILLWVVWAVRTKMKHEMAVSTGFLLYPFVW